MAQVAQVRVRKRGKTFSYIFEAGKIDGKRKVVEKGGFATKAAAYKAGVEAYNDFLHGNIGITSESITLKDFMTSWLENVVALNVKMTTLASYHSRLSEYILPHLGEEKVQDLTPAKLDKWVRALQRKGFSHNTIEAAHSLLGAALKYAIYPAQLISMNPADYIKVPRNAPRNIVKRHVITPERFNALLKKYPFGTPLYIPLLLLYHTGMRISEVVGLTWSDVDFAKKEISVRRQLTHINNRGYYLTAPKTKASVRYIIADEFLLGELRRWQIQQSENEEKIGDSYAYIYVQDNGSIQYRSKLFSPLEKKVSLICTRDNGHLVLGSYIAMRLVKEGLNAHSFRHTHATRLIEQGGIAKAVAYRLGHSNTLITQNLYTHNTRKLQEDLAALFAQDLQTNH